VEALEFLGFISIKEGRKTPPVNVVISNCFSNLMVLTCAIIQPRSAANSSFHQLDEADLQEALNYSSDEDHLIRALGQLVQLPFFTLSKSQS